MGAMSFADRRAHVGVDASVSSAGRTTTGGLSVGTPRGPFASVGAGEIHNDDPSDRAPLVAATAGVGFTLRPRPNTQICPFFSVQMTGRVASRATVMILGREYDILGVATQSYGLGASVGGALSSVTEFDLVPFLSAAVIMRNTDIYLSPEGPREAAGDHYYTVAFGAGALMERMITLRPSVTVTFAEERTSAAFGLHLSISFGRVTPRRPVGEGEGSLTTVWLNTDVGVYYCPGSMPYGATPHGRFMTEREALVAGASPAQGRRC
jgi:hypothetical protein